MFKNISELPRKIDKVLMILDEEEDICYECTEEDDNERWFYGKNNGAYPINEIQSWKEI
jgi:hypothetical protein